MSRYLSQFSHRYVRSLVYMLQASEYHARDFLAWHRRVSDFRYVEKRKQLDWTLKAKVLCLVGWSVEIVALIAVVAGLFWGGSVSLIAIALFFIAPLALPYALVFVVFVGQLLQKPLEGRRIARAKVKLRAHPALKIAIAGSYGKTSMREILKAVLSSGKRVASPPASYNTPLGVASFVDSLAGDEEVIIFEFGEYYPGDVERLCQLVEPDIGIVTGINEAHLEKFGSLENTAATIFEIADHLASKPLYVNAENATAKAHAPKHAVLYSCEAVDGWRIEEPRTDLSGTSFVMQKDRVVIRARSKLLGVHMIGSIAAAAHIVHSLGLSVAQIEQGIARTRPFEHRLEPRVDTSGVVTLDDSYNGNPDGAKAVIQFLGSLRGRRFYVTPGLVEMGIRKEAVHRAIGKQLADSGVEQVVLIRNSVTPFIEAGLRDANYRGTITWFDDGPSAYAALPHMTVAGDIVLLQNDWPDQYA